MTDGRMRVLGISGVVASALFVGIIIFGAQREARVARLPTADVADGSVMISGTNGSATWVASPNHSYTSVGNLWSMVPASKCEDGWTPVLRLSTIETVSAYACAREFKDPK